MPKTVLLADDSVTIQHAVGISLANEDIALINVNNGEDAVIKARAIKPDLILLDVVMPKLSGYEACKQIRQDPSIKHTPVIMLVGAIEGFDEKKFKESMANDYIIKPFESGALINKVRKYLYPELSRAQAPVSAPAQKVTIPQIPVQTPPPSVSAPKPPSSPQIPIPPKPAVPPVVPPVIPQQPASTPPASPSMPRFTTPPVPQMPPHIQMPPTETPGPAPTPNVKVEQPSEQIPVVPPQPQPPSQTEQQRKGLEVGNFVENLIQTSSEVKQKEEIPESVDEISPQEIEEITSEIPDISKGEEIAPPPAVVDIVSQVESAFKSSSDQIEAVPKSEEQKPFDMEEWGKDLKREIMEASGITSTPEEKGPPPNAAEAPQIEENIPNEPSPSMEVVSIAESITTEPVGEEVKPVEVPPVEPQATVEVEPTSLVEKKIDLSSPLSEETIKQVREVVERVVWEVVPELAERLIKEEIKRLMSEKEE